MSARRFVALAAMLAFAGCDGDDPDFPDGGNPGGGGDDAAASRCGATTGSCRHPDEPVCEDYSGDYPAEQARASCEGAGYVWADAPCSTIGTVGGCRAESPTGVGTGWWCITAWQFPPTTTDEVMQACTGLSYVPPPA